MIVKYIFCPLVLMLAIVIEHANSQSEKIIPIGLIYCDEDEFKKTQEMVTELNSQVKSSKYKYKFDLRGQKLNKMDNMISLSTLVCQNFINLNSIFTVLVGNTSCLNNDHDDYILTKTTISSTFGFYQIPVIDLNSQDAVYSDKVEIWILNFLF